jgi:hypothetical protein
MTHIYLKLNNKTLTDSEKEAAENGKANDPNDEDAKKGMHLLYEDMRLDGNQNIEYDDGEIHLYGDLMQGSKDFGFIDISFRPDAELVANIIESYVKQLNKVRTMLEATK